MAAHVIFPNSDADEPPGKKRKIDAGRNRKDLLDSTLAKQQECTKSHVTASEKFLVWDGAPSQTLGIAFRYNWNASRMPWDSIGTPLEYHFWNIVGHPWRFYWNAIEIALEYHWNTIGMPPFGIDWNTSRMVLEYHQWNPIETPSATIGMPAECHQGTFGIPLKYWWYHWNTKGITNAL